MHVILSSHKESGRNLLRRLQRFCLTQAAELTDDGRERVVHHALQLAADALGEFPSAEVAGLDVPLHQRHGETSRRHTLRRGTQKNKKNKDG